MNDKKHKAHIEYMFDSYCKKIIKNEARNIQKEMARQRKREISLESLTDKQLSQFIIHSGIQNTIFTILDLDIVVKDDMLAEALQQLDEYERTIILLHYFLEMSDQEISETLHSIRRKISRHRNRILKEMHQILEHFQDE